ncbi:MAG: DUF4192 domain-containing protein [Candidatus Nanopelagicales bacterium]
MTEPVPALPDPFEDLPTTGGGPDPGTAAIRVTGPSALIASVPHLLGFRPTASLVVVVLSGERNQVRVTARIDLPTAPAPGYAAGVAGRLTRARGDQAVVVVYPPDTDTGTEPGRAAPPTDPAAYADLVDEVAAALTDRDLALRDALWVQAGRWGSYLCSDPGCCPAEGRPLDDADALRARSSLVLAGLGVMPDRQALVESLAPEADASDEAAVRAALHRVTTGQVVLPLTPRAVVDEVAAVLARPRVRAARHLLTAHEVALVLGALAGIRVRDGLMHRLTDHARNRGPGAGAGPDLLVRAEQALSECTRRAVGGAVAPVATVLAAVAWLTGSGARALVALDRALDDDPGYTLAHLLRAAIDGGLPPQQWATWIDEVSLAQCLGEESGPEQAATDPTRVAWGSTSVTGRGSRRRSRRRRGPDPSAGDPSVA